MLQKVSTERTQILKVQGHVSKLQFPIRRKSE